MNTFKEILENIPDENIKHNADTQFTFTSEDGIVVIFYVRESENLIYNGTALTPSVVLTFTHTSQVVICEMCSVAIQYAIVSTLDSDITKSLRVVSSEDGFSFDFVDFPTSVEVFKSEFAEFLKCCKSLSGNFCTSYPIERLALSKDTQHVLDFDSDNVSGEILDAAQTLLEPIFDSVIGTLPKFNLVNFTQYQTDNTLDNDKLFDLLLNLYCSMYFDKYEIGNASKDYVSKLEEVYGKDFHILLRPNSMYLVYGTVYAYLTDVAASDIVGLQTEYVVTTGTPVDLSEIIFHTLD